MAVKQPQVTTWLRAEWDRALGVALIVAGVVALFAGYQGAAEAAFVVEALSYLVSGGLGGVVLIAGGLTLILSADLHDEWRKLDGIEDAIRSLGTLPETSAPTIDLVTGDEAGREVAAGSGAAGASRRWRRRSVGAFGLLALVCGGALALAWDTTASAAEPGDAFEAAASGSAAVTLYGLLAVALLVIQRRRNMGRRQRLLSPFALLATAADSATAPPAAPLAGQRLLVVPGLARYHRPGCAALAGAAARPATDADLTTLRACGLCGDA